MTTLNVERASVGWGFWLRWVLASAVGFGLGAAVFSILFPGAGLIEAEEGTVLDAAWQLVGLILFGTLIGVAQWLVLRQTLDRVGWWIPTSVVSLALGSLLGFSMGSAIGTALGSPPLDFMLAAVVGMLMVGGGAGLLQWLILRRQVKRAGWWVLASSLGFVVGVGVSGALSFALGLDENTFSIGVAASFMLVSLVAAPGGAVLGAITGAALVWLLRQPVPEATRHYGVAERIPK